MSQIKFHAPICCATQRNAFWSHTKREGFTKIHPPNNYNETSTKWNEFNLRSSSPKYRKRKDMQYSKSYQNIAWHGFNMDLFP